MEIEVRCVFIFVLQYDYKHRITSNDSYCVVIEQKKILCLTQYEEIKIKEDIHEITEEIIWYYAELFNMRR